MTIVKGGGDRCFENETCLLETRQMMQGVVFFPLQSCCIRSSHPPFQGLRGILLQSQKTELVVLVSRPKPVRQDPILLCLLPHHWNSRLVLNTIHGLILMFRIAPLVDWEKHISFPLATCPLEPLAQVHLCARTKSHSSPLVLVSPILDLVVDKSWSFPLYARKYVLGLRCRH